MDTSAPHTPLLFAIRGPLARGDLPGLYARVCALLRSTPATRAVCDIAGVRADAVSADALAQLQLAARRHDCRITLRGGSTDLRSLIDLMGLGDVLPG